MAKEYTLDEIAKHSSRDDLWVAVDGRVFDLSKFSKVHPGGLPPLLDAAGTEATELFYGLHRSAILDEPRYQRFCIGKVCGADEAKRKKPVPEVPGVVPYGEAAGFWRKYSPYYNKTHEAFRAELREFIDREIRPSSALDDEENNPIPPELNLALGKAGILACCQTVVAKHPIVKKLGFRFPGGVSAEEFDVFHELIYSEEFKRLGTYGLADGLMGGLYIGLPPILKFGSEDLIERVATPCLRGEKRIALAITEPYAGSDVKNIRTRGVKSPDGKHYLVTGVKKWITGGMYADYFSALVRTGKDEMSMLLIERDDGTCVNTRPIKTSYSGAAGTAYVEFVEAKVPVENVIGVLGRGFYQVMANFNKERWGMISAGNRMSRLMVEECFKWAMQREIFGKKLIDQPVIRAKLAEMAADVESVHSMLEDLTYQMLHMDEEEIDKYLAGPIALLKYKQTRVATNVSDQACGIFGGRSLTRSGMGQYVEKFQRSFKMQAILGGSEEIMADLAIRQAMRDPSGRARL